HDAGDVAHRVVVEMGAPFGDLPEPDGREMGPGLGFDGNRLDEGANLVDRVALGAGHRVNAAADGLEHVAEDFSVEGGLAGEVVVDHRLVQAGGAGDAVDAGAGEAAGGELRGGGGEDPVAGADAGSRRRSGDARAGAFRGHAGRLSTTDAD